MNFYRQSHRHYCGIDLHTRSMYLCVQDHHGKKLLHRDLPADPQRFLQAIQPFRDNLVVGCECTFSWYWLADLCVQHQIPFVLGHALYMKAIHGGKNKNDKIDSDKIATLLRGGMFPVAYVYPAGMRETRDLLRRRMHLVHIRGGTLAHIQNTNSQYNLPPFAKKLCHARNRHDVAQRFTNDSVRTNIELDLDLIDHYDGLITKLELYLVEHAKVDDAYAFHLLRSVPGIGKILALVLLYEIHRIERFPSAGDFLCYARLISGRGESAGKPKGVMGRKIGNPHLKWAFSEAACLMIRESDQAKRLVQRLEAKHGKPHALAVLRARIGRAVYYMLKRKEPFDIGRFFTGVATGAGAKSSPDHGDAAPPAAVAAPEPAVTAGDATGSSSLCADRATDGDAAVDATTGRAICIQPPTQGATSDPPCGSTARCGRATRLRQPNARQARPDTATAEPARRTAASRARRTVTDITPPSATSDLVSGSAACSGGGAATPRRGRTVRSRRPGQTDDNAATAVERS